MPKRTVSYREGLLESLTDPEEAACYLQAALADSNEAFLVALRDVAEAKQMAKVAKGAGVAREALYRMLSEYGNPTLSNFRAILKSVGLDIDITPITAEKIPVPASPSLSGIKIFGIHPIGQYNPALAHSGFEGTPTMAANLATPDLRGVQATNWNQRFSASYVSPNLTNPHPPVMVPLAANNSLGGVVWSADSAFRSEIQGRP